MPNIADYDTEDEWMAACVPVRIEEGDSQERAQAACLSMWAERDKGTMQPKEHKTFPSLVTETNEELGIVDAVFAVFGNVDEGADIVHPGSFRKTFAERGHKVRVLDHHNARSILNVIGKPLELRELSREELPAELRERYPQATGGAYAKVQFLMDVPEGRGAFVRLRDKAVDEWSFGYDVLDHDYSKATVNGKEVTVRNLRTLKLYEVSPVIWGLNPATMTVGAKDGDKAAVMKTESDGQHPASHYLVVEDPEKVDTWHLRVRDADGELDHRLMGGAWAALHEGYRGNVYEGPGKAEAIRKLRALYEQEDMETPKALQELFSHVKAESLDQRLEAIRQAWYDQTRTPVTFKPHAEAVSDSWVREIFDTYVIVEDAGELYRYPYAEDEQGQIVFGEPVQVRTEYVAIEKGIIALFDERKERLIESLREALAEAETLVAATIGTIDTAPADAGRDEHAKAEGAEPPLALTPQQEAQRQQLLSQIQQLMED